MTSATSRARSSRRCSSSPARSSRSAACPSGCRSRRTSIRCSTPSSSSTTRPSVSRAGSTSAISHSWSASASSGGAWRSGTWLAGSSTDRAVRRYPEGLMPAVLDIEQSILLLELEPPFEKRDVQMARRRMAKRWHPDIAPPGKQFEHERHLKAINQAADQLESLAEGSRGGRVSRNAVKVSAAAARQARAEAGARAYEAEQRRRTQEADRQKHDPFGSRVPDHSVVHRYARCLSYPEWGVGSVTGIYFTGDGDDVQQWARVKF